MGIESYSAIHKGDNHDRCNRSVLLSTVDVRDRCLRAWFGDWRCGLVADERAARNEHDMATMSREGIARLNACCPRRPRSLVRRKGAGVDGRKDGHLGAVGANS
jgi:hypothetical protein